MTAVIVFEKIDPGASIPQRGSVQAAGLDLRAIEQKVIHSKCTCIVRTGLKIQLPPGYEAQVRPRSGLAAMSGISVLNSPGTIDSDYRGEIKVLIINHGAYTYTVEPGHRIAQLVIQKLPDIVVKEGKIDEDTARGAGGFGSTGKEEHVSYVDFSEIDAEVRTRRLLELDAERAGKYSEVSEEEES